MNTPTPTGNTASAVPAWLPDETTLARLATELFGPLTGADTAAAHTAPAIADLPAELPTEVAGLPAAPAPGHPSPQPQTPAWQFESGIAMPPAPGVDFPGLPGVPPVTPRPAISAADRAATPERARLPFTGLDAAVPQAAGPAQPEPRTEVLYADRAGAPSFYFIQEPPPPNVLAPALPADGKPLFDVEGVRRDFPILTERVNGRELVWLDNAATTHKPQVVIERLAYFYAHENSNIHRGAHALAARATDAYEGARRTVADFVGAASGDEIVFTRGTTEAINLVAQTWGRKHVGRDDEIVLSQLEHHANIVPWQQLAEETGARLRVIPVDDDGRLLLDRYADLLSDRTRLVAVAHVSNVLGTIVPVQAVIAAAHAVGARVLVDGAQAVAHMPVNVQSMDADFYVFSGHKVFAPTGIGALFAKAELLEEMPPWQGGGSMIKDVTFERTIYSEPPSKFEAGTGNIADAVGLGAALDYVSRLGLPNIAAYEHRLLQYATSQMNTVPGLRLIGTSPEKASVLTFALDGCQPDEAGSALDHQGIAVRAGHHCAQPILRRYGFEAAVRPSLAMYNTRAEVDLLVAALRRLAADAGKRSGQSYASPKLRPGNQ
jgi:cysteine desulfurase / selenocysteine lyase